MNKIYKIAWSKAKHAYVVTSEVARSHTKSASGKAVKAALAAAVGMGVLMGGYAADAADTATGSGNGVAYGTGSSAPEAENVAVGKDAHIDYSNGTVRPSRGDIAVGNNAHINNYVNQGGGIAHWTECIFRKHGRCTRKKFQLRTNYIYGIRISWVAVTIYSC